MIPATTNIDFRLGKFANLRSLWIASREPKVWVNAFDNCSDQLETIIVELSVKCFATLSDLEWKAFDTVIARREWPNLCQVIFKVHPLSGWEAVEESFRGAEYSFVQSSANARKQMSAIDTKNILNFEATEGQSAQFLVLCFTLIPVFCRRGVWGILQSRVLIFYHCIAAMSAHVQYFQLVAAKCVVPSHCTT